jgi:hypothetical protein
MKVQLAYDKFEIKVNKNYETGKIAVDQGRFVIIYNEAQNKLIEYILDKKNEDDVRYIQEIHVSDLPISSSESNINYQNFILPLNYFDFSSAYAKASQGECKDKTISLYEIKDDDKEEILQDEFNRPSFLARESPMHISSNKVKVYTDDFSISKIFLSYYRYPVQIKLNDEEDPESGFDDSFNPEFDDKFVDRIISIASGEFELNNESQKAQFDKQRAQSKI